MAVLTDRQMGTGTELAVALHPEPGGPVQGDLNLAWRPDGREPQPCDPAVVSDLYCAGDHAHGIVFTHPVQVQSRVTIWFYPAWGPGATLIVAWRWLCQQGPWAAAGWDSVMPLYADPSDAGGAALEAAVALACGEWAHFPGGPPAGLHWDGLPW